MAKCALTGKTWMNGHKVSHSNIKTKKKTYANLQSKRVYDVEKGVWVRMTLSTRALRTLSKKGMKVL